MAVTAPLIKGEKEECEKMTRNRNLATSCSSL